MYYIATREDFSTRKSRNLCNLFGFGLYKIENVGARIDQAVPTDLL